MFSLEKKSSSMLSNHIKIQRHTSLKLFWTVFNSNWCLICAHFSPNSDKITFSLEKAILRIEDMYFSSGFQTKNVLIVLFITNMQLFSSQDVNWLTGVMWIICWLLWCFYQQFVLSVWCLTAPIRWPIVSDVMLNFSKSVQIKKQTWMAWGSVNVSKYYFLGELFL